MGLDDCVITTRPAAIAAIAASAVGSVNQQVVKTFGKPHNAPPKLSFGLTNKNCVGLVSPGSTNFTASWMLKAVDAGGRACSLVAGAAM